MLSFFPEFDGDIGDHEVIFIIDTSNSMKVIKCFILQYFL